MPPVSFSTIVQPDPDGVLLIEVPAHVMAALSEKKRIPVNVTLNGISYRSTIAVYGGKFYIPARREIREAAKVAAGKRAHVTLEADTAARTVMVPSDLAKALSAAKLRPAFDALSFTRRKEDVAAVTEAKRPETRVARIERVVKSLRSQ
ncbi:MAG TPA: YdeI/OmpD-associated family protein [Candidatus Limnocylindria bacterium]|nr:YdeI/OmpD-associated family protein [Candidatus Limnocylindria bacterium]